MRSPRARAWPRGPRPAHRPLSKTAAPTWTPRSCMLSRSVRSHCPKTQTDRRTRAMPEAANNGTPQQDGGTGLVGSHVHTLTIAEVVAETAEARSLVFDVPAEVQARFAYEP